MTTPHVRAALYRVLASLPGVRNIGTTADPLGRVGTGIELAETHQTVIEESSDPRLHVAGEQGQP